MVKALKGKIYKSILPLRFLKEKFSACRFVQFPIDEGTLPSTLFLDKSIWLTWVKFPIELGKCPDSWLLPRSKNSSFLSSPMLAGMMPESWHPSVEIATKSTRLLMQVGICPDIPFMPNLNTVSIEKLQMTSGKTPTKLF